MKTDELDQAISQRSWDQALVLQAFLDEVRAEAVNICPSHEEGISDYLRAHPHLSDQILKIARELRSKFPKKDNISLEHSASRTDLDECLNFVIRQEAYSDNLLEKISEFIENNAQLFFYQSGWVGITTDYKSPASCV